MNTRSILGSSVQVGDAIVFLGRAHRISRIVPYVGAAVDTGAIPADSRIAYEDTGSGRSWGMTLTPSDVVQVVA